MTGGICWKIYKQMIDGPSENIVVRRVLSGSLGWCGERLWWNSPSSLRIAQPSCLILTPALPKPAFVFPSEKCSGSKAQWEYKPPCSSCFWYGFHIWQYGQVHCGKKPSKCHDFFFVTCIEFFSRFFITVSTDLIPWHSDTGIDLEASCSKAWKVSGAGILETLRLCV